MNRETPATALNRQIIDEAAEWFVEINEEEADRETRQRFHAWLARSPEHVRAYLKVLPVWEEGAKLDGPARDPRALIEWARAQSNVVALGPKGAPAPPITPVRVSPRRLIGLAASVMVILAATLVWRALSGDIYATGIGERRLVALDDGSTVEMNSRSRLRVSFDDTERHVELLEGQALFQVTKDVERPFIVRSGEARVRVVGTQFDVYRKPGGTVVTVVEGRVAVSPDSSSAAATLINAGEQVTVAPTANPRPRRANVAVATAWTHQQLVFFRTPLPEVASEFNRYNKRQLVAEDEPLRGFHISGTFSSTDPASLIRFLRAQPGIQINETDSEIKVIAIPTP